MFNFSTKRAPSNRGQHEAIHELKVVMPMFRIPLYSLTYSGNNWHTEEVSFCRGDNSWVPQAKKQRARECFFGQGKYNWSHGYSAIALGGKYYLFTLGAVFEIRFTDPDLSKEGNNRAEQWRLNNRIHRESYTYIPIIVTHLKTEHFDLFKSAVITENNREGHYNPIDLSVLSKDMVKQMFETKVSKLLDTPQTPWKGLRALWRNWKVGENMSEFTEITEVNMRPYKLPDLPFTPTRRDKSGAVAIQELKREVLLDLQKEI
jgi:hypothetical protein